LRRGPNPVSLIDTEERHNLPAQILHSKI